MKSKLAVVAGLMFAAATRASALGPAAGAEAFSLESAGSLKLVLVANGAGEDDRAARAQQRKQRLEAELKRVDEDEQERLQPLQERLKRTQLRIDSVHAKFEYERKKLQARYSLSKDPKDQEFLKAALAELDESEKNNAADYDDDLKQDQLDIDAVKAGAEARRKAIHAYYGI